MPASLPGDSLVNNKANPTLGTPVCFDLLSGPKGSPFDVRRITGYVAGAPTYANDAANATHVSTGALSTGIGFSPGSPIIGPVAPASIKARGFSDDVTPGATKLDPAVPTTDSTFMYIGGGKSGPISTLVKGIPFPTTPYVAGYGIGAAGNGGSRDAGAGPAFTGFQMKMVTAAGAVAPAAAIEAGFINRTGVALVTGQSAHGSYTAASAAVA